MVTLITIGIIDSLFIMPLSITWNADTSNSDMFALIFLILDHACAWESSQSINQASKQASNHIYRILFSRKYSGGCVRPYGRHFHTGYGTAYGIFIVIQWSIKSYFIESQWICRIPYRIPYENASRTGVRILPTQLAKMKKYIPYMSLQWNL